MTNSLIITIYITLISGVVLAILMVLFQIAIFVLVQNIEEFKIFLGKIKEKIFKGLALFINPSSVIKKTGFKKN